MNELEKRIEQFYLKLIKCIEETLCKKQKSTNNSSHNDFIMKRFMRCE